MKKFLLLLGIVSTLTMGAYQIIPEQVGIGSSKPDASASLHLTGVTKGFIPNKLTTAQRNAIPSPARGLMVYNTNLDELQLYNGSGWVTVGAGGAGGVDAWATATVYAVDDVVIFNQELYLCQTNHTSGVFATDLANGYWLIISDDVSSTGTITDTAIPRFVGTSGNVIDSSGVTVDASNNVAGAASLAIGGSLNASSILDTVSTTKGTRPCPSMSEVQRDAIGTPATGLCVYNTTSNTLNIYDGSAWVSAGGGVSLWETAKAYKINDVVIESDKIYRALTNHTSGTFATDLANGDWTEVSGLPQPLDTTDSPTFDDVTLNKAANGGPINVGDSLNYALGTGLVYGGQLSVGTDTAKFDVAAGFGYITDKTNPSAPTLTKVTWSAFDEVTTTNLATSDVTYVLINSSGAIVQQTTYPTPQQRRENIFLGRLPHINRTNITFAIELAEYVQGGINHLYDLFDSLGPFTVSGSRITANGANLSVNLSNGIQFNRSFNYATNPEDPHEVSITGGTAVSLRYGTQTTYIQTPTTVLLPASYDNAGTVTAVPSNNNATIQRIYLFPTGALRVYYGQNVYSNFASALANLDNDSFIENPNSQNFAVHIASIVITKNCTSLQDDTCSKIVPTGKFGSGGSAGGGSTTLQQAYNNSVTPQITTSTSGGSLDIRRGSAADTDNVLRIQNGSGSTTATITGAGVIAGSNLSGTNTGDLLGQGQSEVSASTINTLEAPKNQLTTTDTGKRLIETGNNNVLKDPSFEGNSLQWVTYADAAGTSPVDGTGGTANVTVAYTTTNPLNGKKSMLFTKDAANRQGQGTSINFTIPDINKGKVNNIKISYDIVSGTYATGDLTMWVINVDPASATNGRVIQPSAYTIENSGLKESKFLEFQSDIDSNLYRLVIHVTSTSASAYSLRFDDVSVGLGEKIYGSVATDWVSYVPIISTASGTMTNVTATGKWRRIGDTAEIQFRIVASGSTGTWASPSISLPSGLSVDTNKKVALFGASIGNVALNNSADNTYFNGKAYTVTGNTVTIAYSINANGAATLFNQGSPFTFDAADTIEGSVTVPIQGWSSSQQLSNDADTRVVAASYNRNSSQSISASSDTTLIANVKNIDTHGAYNTSNGRYYCISSGVYNVSASVFLSASTATGVRQLRLIKRNSSGGVTEDRYLDTINKTNTNNEEISLGLTAKIQCNMGESLEIVAWTNASGVSTIANIMFLEFEKLSGPSQIAASETVAAYYTGAPPTGSLGLADNIVTFGTRVKDTHNAYSSGSYTVPVSGTYAIQASITFTGTWTVGQSAYAQVFVNGTVKSNQGIFAQAAGTFRVNPNVTVLSLPLLAGDVVTIRSYAQGSSLSYIADGATNFFSIVRTGNY